MAVVLLEDLLPAFLALLVDVAVIVLNPDNFYENLKKLRLDDNFIVKSISTTVLNRVSHRNRSLCVISVPSLFYCSGKIPK